MKLLRNSGKPMSGVVIFVAFLFGVLLSLMVILAADSPGAPPFAHYRTVSGGAILGTFVLFAGLPSIRSPQLLFPILIIVGSGSLICVLTLYAITAIPGELHVWTLLFISVEFAALIVSLSKLRQLRIMR